MSRITRIGVCTLWVVCAVIVHAQNQNSPGGDPKALSLAARSLASMTSGTMLTGATLTGTAKRTVGTDTDSGSAVLKVRSATGTRLDLGLAKGQLTEIHNTQTGAPKHYWFGPDQVVHRAPLHNSWVDAGWYFPPVSVVSMLSDPLMVLSYLGHETRSGVPVEHLRASRHLSGQDPAVTALVQRLSTIDLYIDSSSTLPVAVAFAGHPDNDAGVNFPIEIRFSNYQSMNGAQVPMQIEELVDGGTCLTISFSSITLNSGFSDSDFQIR